MIDTKEVRAKLTDPAKWADHERIKEYLGWSSVTLHDLCSALDARRKPVESRKLWERPPKECANCATTYPIRIPETLCALCRGDASDAITERIIQWEAAEERADALETENRKLREYEFMYKDLCK